MAHRRFRLVGLAFTSALTLGACAPPDLGRNVAALGAAHLLFVNLGGATVSAAASDDATVLHSQLGAVTLPAFEASLAAPSVDPVLAATVLVDRVREYFLPFDVEVVSTAPAAQDFSEIAVGGLPSSFSPAQPTGVAGISVTDCSNANARNLGFVFGQSFTPQFGGLVSLAAIIAHEAGHGYGLEHTSEPLDLMYSVPASKQTLEDLYSLSFATGSFSSYTAGSSAAQIEQCGRANPLDNRVLLLAALHARMAPLSGPPTILLDSPPITDTLPPTFTVEISAFDDVAVQRVEIYRDLELIDVLNAAPYHATLTLPVATDTTLTIEAVDADGQRASVTRHFAVSASADLGLGVDDAAVTAALDAGTEGPPAVGGCSFAAKRKPAGPALLWVLGVIWACVRSRRSSLPRA